MPNLHSAQISQRYDGCNTYIFMKTNFPPSYLKNGFVATHRLWCMKYCYKLLPQLNHKVLNKLFKAHYKWYKCV